MADPKLGDLPDAKGDTKGAPKKENTTGPKRGEHGQYLPSSYPLRNGNLRTDR